MSAISHAKKKLYAREKLYQKDGKLNRRWFSDLINSCSEFRTLSKITESVFALQFNGMKRCIR